RAKLDLTRLRVRVREEVGIVLVRPRREAREILLDEDRQPLAAVERLLRPERHLIRLEPALQQRLRQRHRYRIPRECGAQLPLRPDADAADQLRSCAETGAVLGRAGLREPLQLGAGKSEAHGISAYSELHRR